MTWVDACLVVLIVLTLYGGTRRGLVHETTDWCVFLLSSLVALRWYRWLGEMLRFVGWEQELLRAWSAAILFGSVGIVVLVLGLSVEREVGHKIHKEMSAALGLLLATAKAIFLGWVALVCLWYAPLDAELRDRLHLAPVVNQVLHTASPIAEAYVQAVAPRSVSADLVPEMQKWHF